jgi:hypothetical protein
VVATVAANNAARAIFITYSPPAGSAGRVLIAFRLTTPKAMLFLIPVTWGRAEMRLWRNGRAERGCGGCRDLATGRPFLYRFLLAESRLSAGGSISLVGCKNVAKKITGR